MSERERLIKEIKNRIPNLSWVDIDEILLLILDDRRKMLAEVEKPLITAQAKHSKIKAVVSQHAFDFCDIGVLIDQSLAKINEMKG